MAEMKAFVFAVVFIIIFSGLVSTIPSDFLGSGYDLDETFIPVDPNFLTGFVASEPFTAANFVPLIGITETYSYTLNSRDWICSSNGTALELHVKVYFLGFVFLGQTEQIKFVTTTGEDRGLVLSFSEVENDANDGVAQYNLLFSEAGNTAGDYIIYWNTTTYSSPVSAWNSNALYFLHGVGVTANTDVVSLLIGLLFLQLPDVPFLVNLLLATPIWASIIFVLWFIIKESLPFV